MLSLIIGAWIKCTVHTILVKFARYQHGGGGAGGGPVRALLLRGDGVPVVQRAAAPPQAEHRPALQPVERHLHLQCRRHFRGADHLAPCSRRHGSVCRRGRATLRSCPTTRTASPTSASTTSCTRASVWSWGTSSATSPATIPQQVEGT